MLGSPHRERIRGICSDHRETRAKVTRLLELDRLREGSYLLLLDGFERFLDPQTNQITDPDLRTFADVCLRLSRCIRFVATSRFPPRLATGGGEPPQLTHRDLRINEGLPEKDAVALFRDEHCRNPSLRDATDDQLAELAGRCDYIPLVLQSVFMVLNVHPTLTVAGLLSDPDALSRMVADPA